MKKNNRQILVLILAAVVVAGGLWWSMRDQGELENDLSGSFHFHPDAVMTLDWRAGDAEFEFRRKTRQDAWTPAVEAARIQSKLNILSTIALREMPVDVDGPVTLEVEFSPGNSWAGAFDGERFVWTKGSMKGRGAVLDELNRREFTGGRFAFEAKAWQWCPKRPKEIVIEAETGTIGIRQDGIDWKRKTASGEKKLDPTAIENWLGRYCSDRIVRSRDLELFPLSGFGRKIVFVFTDGTTNEFSMTDGWVRISKDQAIETANMAKALVELTSIPD
ncbi:MAG: hypothetical protein V4760_11270 [Bdellovibrionota bacterium]